MPIHWLCGHCCGERFWLRDFHIVNGWGLFQSHPIYWGGFELDRPLRTGMIERLTEVFSSVRMASTPICLNHCTISSDVAARESSNTVSASPATMGERMSSIAVVCRMSMNRLLGIKRRSVEFSESPSMVIVLLPCATNHEWRMVLARDFPEPPLAPAVIMRRLFVIFLCFPD